MKVSAFESFSKPQSEKEIRTEIEVGLDDYKRSKTGEDEEDLKAYRRELGVIGDFDDLIKFFGENQESSDRSKIERYNDTSDRVEKLKLLRSMPLREAIECIKNYGESPQAIEFLTKRLDFYEKMVNGTATRTSHEQEYDSKTGQYKDVIKEYPINSDISQDNIRLGVLRDLMQSAMIGTPEMGALKITNKRIREKENNSNYKSFATLKGYNSGIFDGNWGNGSESNLGIYPVLIHAYENAKKQVESTIKKFDLDTPKERLEHKAVLKMSDWLIDIYDNYTKSLYYSNEPSRTDPKEALAWAQLGSKIRERMLKMRKKLPDHALNFSNVERFIGKCGDNKYEGERKRLHGQIKFIKEGDDIQAKEQFVAKENEFSLAKQEAYHSKESVRLTAKFEKSKSEIEKLDLPNEEKKLQLESVTSRFEKAIQDLTSDVESKKAYFSARTSDQLLGELQERQTLVSKRYEQRKSLADKAFDLKFHFDHPETTIDQDGEKIRTFNEYTEIIDWVNYAPMGTIKRAHKMIQRGLSDDSIVQLSVADIVCGNGQITREALDKLKPIIKDAKSDDYNAKNKLQSILKVGNILSRFDEIKVSVDEVIEFSEKNFNGMTPAIKEFGFETVKDFLKNNLDLHTVVNVKNTTSLHGYNLDNKQIINIATSAHDIADLNNALRNLSLDQVENIYKNGITYNDFNTVSSALATHNEDNSFSKTLDLSQELAGEESSTTGRRRGGGRSRRSSRHGDQFNQLSSALDSFTLDQVKLLLSKGSPLHQATNTAKLLKEKDIPTSLEEIASLSSKVNSHTLEKGIDVFGIDDVRKIVLTKECDLESLLNIKGQIDGTSWQKVEISDELKASLKVGGLNVLIAIAKAGSLEHAVKTIEAGFTINEIVRFPFLISALVTKK